MFINKHNTKSSLIFTIAADPADARGIHTGVVFDLDDI